MHEGRQFKGRFLLAQVATALLVLYWLALFAATHIPHPPVPAGVSDKLLHFVAYAILGFVWGLADQLRCSKPWSSYLTILSLITLYGAADELLQIPVGRTCDVRDWLVDIGGATFGLVALAVFKSLVRIWLRSAPAADEDFNV